jgi:hypothetical protein
MLSEKEYSQIGKLIVHAILNDRNTNRFLSRSVYYKPILNIIENAKGEILEEKSKEARIKRSNSRFQRMLQKFREWKNQ